MYVVIAGAGNIVTTLTVVLALALREWYQALAFLLAGGLTVGIGFGARRTFADAPTRR